MPRKNASIKPMLAHVGSIDDLQCKDCIFEPKVDGIRALCHISTSMTLYTRSGHNITKQFPELNFRAQVNATQCILDGEIVAYNAHGNPEFNLLQGRDQLTRTQAIAEQAQAHPATFIVFDILEKNGVSLCNLTLLERKKILAKTIKDSPGIERIPYTHEGKKLWQLMKKRGLEGVMAKTIDGLYHPEERTSDWLKIKFLQSIDCIIVGYTQSKRLVSALALGLYDKKELLYIGKVGTGFSEKELTTLYAQIKKTPLAKEPLSDRTDLRDIIWLKPKLVCEIQYQEFTKKRHLRKPVFLRMRTDKKPVDCTVSSTW